MINVTIDNKQIQVPEGTTILKAARMAGIHILLLFIIGQKLHQTYMWQYKHRT